MDAKKCDRCGNYFEIEVDVLSLEIKKNSFTGKLMSDAGITSLVMTEIIDLCPECTKDFDYWLNEKSKVNEE